MTSWTTIWRRKADAARARHRDDRLGALMEAGGHTSALGGVCPDELRAAARRFGEILRVPPDGALLDIGCGAGAVLYTLDPRPQVVVGVDPSDASVALAAEAMPDGHFQTAEADQLPVPDGRFDGALSCGVVIYFPDLAYVERALAEMVRALRPAGRGLLVDLMDVAHRDRREARRRAAYPPGEYDRLFADLPHLYLDPAWVHATLASLGCRSWEVDAFGPDYSYATEAFHVAFETGA